MDPKKIEAVSKIDASSINTLERVRSFLGLCSYYRRFIPKFSKIAAPLTDLTKTGVDVAVESQKPECQEAIEKLKVSITTEPVLATPRMDREFIVKTDGAQTEGIGGVLGQHDDDQRERAVGYYSRRLIPAERKYTVTEIELLAALESIKNWRPYLWGRHFRLVIDHAALRWLHSMRDSIEGGPSSRLMRWILKLSEYDFEVEHKAGVTHTDADGLSRLAAAAERCICAARHLHEVTVEYERQVAAAHALEATLPPNLPTPADISARLYELIPRSELDRSLVDGAVDVLLGQFREYGRDRFDEPTAFVELAREAL